MPYLIDGHNLIPRVPGLSLEQINDEINLIQVLQEYARKSGKQIDVYFDKAPPGSIRKQKFGKVTAYFIPESSTADAAIKGRLRKLGKAAKNWTVVSADNEILLAARSVLAKSIDPGEFVRHHLVDQEGDVSSPGTQENVSLSDAEIREWLDLFGNK